MDREKNRSGLTPTEILEREYLNDLEVREVADGMRLEGRSDEEILKFFDEYL